MYDQLRPLERAVLKRSDEGMPLSEIAWRFRRSPGAIRRIVQLTGLDREFAGFVSDERGLRPLERCIVNARQSGVDTVEIAARLRRSPDLVSRIEEYTNYRLAQEDDMR